MINSGWFVNKPIMWALLIPLWYAACISGMAYVFVRECQRRRRKYRPDASERIEPEEVSPLRRHHAWSTEALSQ